MGLNYGVDFRGGTIMMASTQEDVPVGDFRDAAERAQLRRGRRHRGLRRHRPGPAHDADAPRHHRRRSRQPAGGHRPRSGRADRRLSRTSSSCRSTASAPRSRASSSSTASSPSSSRFVGIMIYVWLRFEWQFALGAVASLVHDAIVVVGLFCADAARVQPDDRRRDPDGDRLLDQRHRRRLRPRARGAAQVQEDAAAPRC